MQKIHYYFCSNINWNVIFGAYVIMPNGDEITTQILVMNQLKGKAKLKGEKEYREDQVRGRFWVGRKKFSRFPLVFFFL